jgi:hypothetical protein
MAGTCGRAEVLTQWLRGENKERRRTRDSLFLSLKKKKKLVKN